MLRNIAKKVFLFFIKPNKIHVFGDSHSYIFSYINREYPLFPYHFSVTVVTGATAQGMRNPNSKTQCLTIFKEKIASINDKKTEIFFLLGEVDTGFVIWYRAQKYKESIEQQLCNSIDAYLAFLLQVKEQGFNNISVIAAPLPTIVDDQNWGEVADLRKDIKASQLERTRLTLEYNTRLKVMAESNYFKFIDTSKYLLDVETGTIKKEFINKDTFDHHLDNKNYSNILIKAIKLAKR